MTPRIEGRSLGQFKETIHAYDCAAILFTLAECSPCAEAKALFADAMNLHLGSISHWIQVELSPDPEDFAWLDHSFSLRVAPSFAVMLAGKVCGRRPGIRTKSGTLSALQLESWITRRLNLPSGMVGDRP